MHDPWKNVSRPSVLGDLDPTRARPEPWFVDSGRGLMIVVLLTCAILVVLRAAQIVYAAESAWTWWRTRPEAISSPPVQTSAPPLPIASRSMNPADWFTSDDYPIEALRADAQGSTRIEVRFARNGMPKACRTMTSSGHVALDRATCDVVRRRGKSRPVRAGQPEPLLVKTIHWRLPPP